MEVETMESGENLVEREFNVKGMHCKSCAESIESRVKSLPGVRDVKVDLAHDKVFVKYDSNAVGIDEIKAQVNALGYSLEDGRDAGNRGKGGGSGDKGKSGWKQGLFYGLLPHTGCIAFIAGSILGVTLLTQLFTPLLMNPYFFYALIALSIALATVSSALYLRKNGLLSAAGAKRSWKYLTVMYGSTIGVNLLFFLVVFPLLASTTASAQVPSAGTGAVIATGGAADAELSSVKLKVDIPCSGHAPLITRELNKINGVTAVKFGFPNVFDVTFDPSKTSRGQILALDVFKTYKATELTA